MKKLLLYSGIVLAFLILLALILGKILLTPTPNTTGGKIAPLPLPSAKGEPVESPQLFIEQFYSYYLNNLMADADFPGNQARRPEFQALFTTRFMSTWNEATEEAGGDPIVRTEAYGPDDLGTVHATTIQQSPATATVSVTIGPTNHSYTLLVGLVKGTTSWQIDSVTDALER